MEESRSKLLKYIDDHVETYDEVKALIFTNKMLNKNYNLKQQRQIVKRFLEFKDIAICSIDESMTMPWMSAFILYRIINKILRRTEKICDTMNKLLDIADSDVKSFKTRKDIFIDFPWADFNEDIEKINFKNLV